MYPESKVNVSDNSGVKLGKCVKILKASRKVGGKPGNLVVLSARRVKHSKWLTKGEVCKGVIIRMRKNTSRYTGLFIRSFDNSIVLVDQKSIPLATRIFGPILKELKYENFPKVVSLARTII